ncbi:DUF4397 domain-containing protein [Sedimentibacter sp.]|uniref:DUF4397 domain-containing protein n=1 Tax=Sedimentibacter sp. TaxID=1960295 RepID=UPI0028A699C7|nr:DUF4397 domain-containing protein [Sedimentibacter sp.]
MNFGNSTYNDYYKNIIYGQMSRCFCNKSFFRLLNTYIDCPVDVHVNEIVMGENIKSGGFTRYAQFKPGTYRIKIYKTNEPKKLIFESDINIDKNLAYTGVIAADDNDKTDISLLIIPEAKENYIKGAMSSVKLANLLMDSPQTELVVSDGAVWFSGINYGGVSNNVAIPSGKYNLELRDKKNKKSVAKIMNVGFAPKMHYTIYLVGNVKKPDIKIIIPEDGVNYLGLC